MENFPEAPQTQEEAKRRLVEVQKRAGWTNIDMARYFGTSAQTVSNWRSGRYSIPFEVMQAIPVLERFVEEKNREEWRETASKVIGAGVVFGSLVIADWLNEDEQADT